MINSPYLFQISIIRIRFTIVDQAPDFSFEFFFHSAKHFCKASFPLRTQSLTHSCYPPNPPSMLTLCMPGTLKKGKKKVLKYEVRLRSRISVTGSWRFITYYTYITITLNNFFNNSSFIIHFQNSRYGIMHLLQSLVISSWGFSLHLYKRPLLSLFNFTLRKKHLKYIL